MRPNDMQQRHSSACGTHGSLPRRRFLFGSMGALSAGLLSAPRDLAAATVIPRKSATACIFINLNGAPSHIDTFDPKDGPWNPRDADIRQYAGGITLSRRFFPTLSGLTNDLCLLRSVSSWEAAHTRGQFYMQTAHSFNPAFAPVLPHIGAVVGFEMGAKGPLPPYLSLAPPGDEQRQGFLPGYTAPFSFVPGPSGLGNLRHDFYGGDTIFNNGYSLLNSLDAPLRANPWSDEVSAYAAIVTQARGLVYNDAVSRVFQFTADEDARYGGTDFARSLLVARNAVRAKLGTVFINATQVGWDNHAQQFDPKNGANIYTLTNELDRALGSLIADLKTSGDLSRTLIVALGEFGRTPGLLNDRDGRDHYMPVMSALMAGGGVRGGHVIGTTNSTASDIIDPGWSANRAIFIEDIVCTIYSALGVDWTKTIDHTSLGRNYIYVVGAPEGQFQPINEVFG